MVNSSLASLLLKLFLVCVCVCVSLHKMSKDPEMGSSLGVLWLRLHAPGAVGCEFNPWKEN